MFKSFVLFMADAPQVSWIALMVFSLVGCEYAISPEAGLASVSGSVPGLIAALAALAQAYRMRVRAQTALEQAVAQAYSQALAKAEEAIVAVKECEKREKRLWQEIQQLRLETMGQRPGN
jgi:hypothetical protein